MAASALAATMGMVTAGPAQAVLPVGQVAVGIAGSDTTGVVMTQIAELPQFATATIDGKTVKTYNIPPFPDDPFVVPGDSFGCAADVSWVKDPLGPEANSPPTKGISPFGSSSGRNYLREESDGTGPGSPAGTDFACIDVSRSSSGPRAVGPSGDVASFEYYAFALDSMSWASTSLKAPAALSTAQLVSIFDCVATDWGQVGGVPGPIQRYFPQVGSGTRAFFISDILGKPSSYLPPSGIAGCPDAINVRENFGDGIANADIDKAIVAYSSAVWSFQESRRGNPEFDLRKSIALKGIGGVTLPDGPDPGTDPDTSASPIRWIAGDNRYRLDTSTNGVVKEGSSRLVTASPPFPGIRYVFNVLDNAGNRQGYQSALKLLGVNNVPGGLTSDTLLCNLSGNPARDAARGVILDNGYFPLGTTTPAAIASSNQAGSTCRKFTP